MFFTIEQLEHSLHRLEGLHPFFGFAFLAFKSYGLQVGKAEEIVFATVVEDFMQKYYRPSTQYEGYYNPYSTTKHWPALRYPTTSLQRITTDTFGDAFLHQKNMPAWGWQRNYIKRLAKHLKTQRLPSFHLAVWLFRNRDWPKNVTRLDVLREFRNTFKITVEERAALFDDSLQAKPKEWLSLLQVTETQLLELIGRPPGSAPQAGALLRYLEVKSVGPAKTFLYHPADRLNIITGDNSLGKTFLLDIIWWALAGDWCAFQALPRPDLPKDSPRILFDVSTSRKGEKRRTATFDWTLNKWNVKPTRESVAGLVIYSRFDGSFAIWDPAAGPLLEPSGGAELKGELILDSNQVWTGRKQEDSRGHDQWLCNGLLLDWVTWQTGGQRYAQQYESLLECLRALSPSSDEPLLPGEPTRFPRGARESPTLQMPYGEVPLQLASAGVQRVTALSYVLVWAWHQHLANSEAARLQPQRRLVLIVDEIEAHLHPKWQRVILKSLMDVVSQLADEVSPQLHIATHSPMVMASAEVYFDEERDGLHHLRLQDSEVFLEQAEFLKRGRIDRWLISEVFGLGQARSVEAEKAINEAEEIQQQASADTQRIAEINSRLEQTLAQDDDFWPRWRFFAQTSGLQK